MGLVCSICQSPDRERLDRRLAAGAEVKALAAESGVSADSLRRHRKNHLPARLVRQEVLREAKDCLDISRLLAVASGTAIEVLTQARASGRHDLQLRAVDRVLACVAVQLKINELVDTQALQERLLALEERLAGVGATPQRVRMLEGAGWRLPGG